MVYHKTLKWYRGLSTGWKCVAWVVLLLVAIGSVFIFALPWLLNSKMRDKVHRLKMDAAMGEAKKEIGAAKEQVANLELVRDEALAKERRKEEEEKALDEEIEQGFADLRERQNQVEEQSDAEQGNFFNNRFRGD